jgi:mutator protein MutT
VVAGVICDTAGKVLIAQRPAGTHMSGQWEFPGGKLGSREERFPGLVRELREELGIDVESAQPLIRLEHRYPDRLIELDFWTIESYRGRPVGREGQALRWVAADDLLDQAILEADRPVITALNLGATVADVGADWLRPDFDPVVLARIAAGGARMVCFDVGSGPAGRRGVFEDLLLRHGLGAAACEPCASRGGLRTRLAALPQRPEFRFALLDAGVASGVDGPRQQAQLRTAIGALAVPVYIPGEWVGHDLARARRLGAQGFVLS